MLGFFAFQGDVVCGGFAIPIREGKAEEYRGLGETIERNNHFTVPTPISIDELEALMQKYSL